MNGQPPDTNYQLPTFREMALADLLDAFASTEAVPGGGSAAAVAGALGVSLLLMVAGMTKTKSGAPEETADLADAAARLRSVRNTLIALIDRDSDAYRGVIAAFKRPKGSEQEQSARARAIDDATRAATDAPLDTMRACQQALGGAVVVAKNGNRNASSDVAVAIELLLAAMRGAHVNVDVNLNGLADASYVTDVTLECDALQRDALADADRARAQLR
jgi:glutamate formiminotransferase/formiminotetrahydrofolate cyclodeaminase